MTAQLPTFSSRPTKPSLWLGGSRMPGESACARPVRKENIPSEEVLTNVRWGDRNEMGSDV